MIEELKEHRSLVIALVVVLAIAAGGILLLQKSKGTETNGGQSTKKGADEKSANEVVRGKLSISPEDGRQIYEIGETVSLTLRGDSDDKDAAGFDAALKVNQNIISFNQAVSKLTSFETFSNVNDERVYVGGIRKLNNNAASIFNNAELATLTFVAKAEGHSAVDFIFKPDETTESNIVLTSSKDGLGDVQGTHIYVGKKTPLTTTLALVVPNTNFKLTLKSVTTESATVEISLGTQSEPKTFVWGAGTVSTNIEKFLGYVFQVQKGPANEVMVYYAPEKSLN